MHRYRYCQLAALLLCGPVWAAHADLSWTAPTQNTDGTPLTDLAGFTIYAGCFESGSYELQPANVGPEATTYRYEGLPNGTTCYFAAAAVNAAGGESAYSVEATKVTAALDEPIPGPVESLRVEWSESVMALAFSNLTDGTSTTNGSATASVAVPDDGLVYLSIAAARNDGSSVQAASPMTVTLGGTLGLTFTLVEDVAYGFRRKQWLYRATNETGSEQSGTVTISVDPEAGFTYREHMWSIDLVTGADLTDPDDAAVDGFTASQTTSLTLPDVGTPGTGDAIYAAFAYENGTGGFALDAALTELGSEVGGADVRSFKTGYDADAGDETPAATSTTNAYYGGIALIVNVAAGGATITPSSMLLMGIGN